MSLWIPVTIAAAAFQTLRFMLQKHLSVSTLTPTGATFARFVYSAPLVILVLVVYLVAGTQPAPDIAARFWLYGAIGGVAQIVATICVVALFASRNFAVGITFKKTEAVQAALLGFLVLGDTMTFWGFAAIAIGLVGLLVLSDPPEARGTWRERVVNRGVALGLASGFFFAVSGVCYRGASLAVASGDPWLRALITLAAVTSLQSVAMALWLGWRAPQQVRAVWDARRVAVFVGLTSMGGSFCWFLAFTLQNAGYVKALGQVELIFSLLASVLFFRETLAKRELWGMGILALSVLLLIAAI